MKQLLLKEMITLIGAEMGAYEVALYEENSKGEVYDTDCPVGYYEVVKEYYLHTYTYRHIADKRLVNEYEFGDLVVLGIRQSTDIDHDYPFSVGVKVKKEQVRWDR